MGLREAFVFELFFLLGYVTFVIPRVSVYILGLFHLILRLRLLCLPRFFKAVLAWNEKEIPLG